MQLLRSWRSLLRRLTGGPRLAAARARPRLESLEDRLVPTNWFVSTLGSDTNPGFPNAPFATIQHAVNVAQSGDLIHVAQGTYGYTGADRLGDDSRFNSPGNSATISGSFLHVFPAVVTVFDKSLQIYGGFNNTFSTWAPSTFHTYIDGGGVNRGVYVLDDNGAAGAAFATPAGLDMEGFTVQACMAKGEIGLPDADRINAFGAGMWVNTATRPTLPHTQGEFLLKSMVFRGNYAQGTNTNAVGGSAAGAAVALRGVENMRLDGVTLDTNLSQGGTGVTRGGQAQGALFLDRTVVNATDVGYALTFYNNRAVAGAASGVGVDSAGNTADAMGGGMALIDSSADLQNVIALNNSVAGGSAANGNPGRAYGGAFFAEHAFLTLSDTDLRGGVSQGGLGKNAFPVGPAGGGGIAILNASVNLNRVQVINNSVVSGSETGLAGSAGGGGVWIARTGNSATLSVQIYDTAITDNTVSFGGGSTTNVASGGGGLWLQGVDATIIHTTIANNHFGANLFDGQGVLLMTGTNADGSARAATALIGDSILADHTNSNGAAALDVNGSPNAVTLTRVLFAGNSKDDNSDNTPNAAGTFNGLSTVVRAADAGFTSPGGPNFDYSIAASSPAVNQAVGSTAATDINNNARTGTPDLGAYEAPAPPRARTSVGLFDPETGIWELRQSNAGGGFGDGGFPDGPLFAYGSGGGHSKPVVGDWDGNGSSTVGVVEVKAVDFSGKPFLTDSNGNPIPVSVFELKNTNGPGVPDIVVPYGSFAATPVAGNWDNNPQHISHIGVVEIQGGVAVWKLRNSFTRGAPDITIVYGGATSIPVVGDWDGNGTITIGVVETVGDLLSWKLRNSNTPGPPDIPAFFFGFDGIDRPIVGDWNNDRVFSPGICSYSFGWSLRNENSGGTPDAGFNFGPNNGINSFSEPWLPVAGDFDGLG